jgi:hypothetical protein
MGGAFAVMSMTNGPIECGVCGAAIDASADTPESRTPCPNCGSTTRTYCVSLASSQPSNYFLDNYVAHKLSLLTECGAPELEENSTWLNAFILNSVFRLQILPKPRAFLFNFLRRAEGAMSAYRDARLALLEYLATPPSTISPYFKALAHLEICVSQCYQGYELLATATGQKVYEPGHGSAEEKLYTIYVDSKHMDRMIHGEKLPAEATAGIWITNSGIESSRGALSFVELHRLLYDMRNLAEQLST